MVKILTWDIETFPNVGDVWDLYNVNISLSQLQESSRVVCFAAKWHDKKEVMFYSEFHHSREEMIDQAYNLLSEADVVVDYNGRRFDRRHMNKEIALSGLGPPAPYKEVDLWQVVIKNFAFPSSKLQYVAEAFGLGSKVKHEGHELWVKCRDGNPVAWEKMKKYNCGDVVLTEKLYDRLLPWIANHPNIQLYDNLEGCPYCGSGELTKEGFRYTNTGRYQRFSCKSCGGWSSSGKREDGVDIRSA